MSHVWLDLEIMQTHIKSLSLLLRGIVAALIAMPTAAHSAHDYARIKSFDVFPSGGPLVPSGGLIEGTDGALYGTSLVGGAFNSGAVFTLNKDGTACRVLHSFGDSLNWGMDEGTNPKAALLEGSDQALYGTTASGGRFRQGTIFAVNKDGTGYQLLHMFSGNLDDGANPVAALIEGSDGSLYGTTVSGGRINQGTIFTITKDGGDYHILHSFTGSQGDGALPQAALFEGQHGALYGTTLSGGSPNRGTIFKIQKDGSGYTVLHRFTGKDGAHPSARLIQGSDGQLYGTTASGGAGLGTVFKLTPDASSHTLLHSFTGIRANPEAALVKAPDGALYGTTPFGGRIGWGSVFRVNEDGTGFQFVHSFSATGGEGRAPRAPLLAASDGNLYGTTTEGGGANQGTVFRIRLHPFPPPTNDVVQTENTEDQPLGATNAPMEEPLWTVPRAVPTSVPDKLVLKGISGAPNRRFAQVNNQTLAPGDRAKVRVGDSNVVVHCLEIRATSVILKLEGEARPRELTMPVK